MTFDRELELVCARLSLEQIAGQQLMDECLRIAVKHLGCSRAGIWIFRDISVDNEFECLAMYDGRKGKSVRVSPYPNESATQFFKKLSLTGVVLALDVRSDEATKSLFIGNHTLNSVRSMMASALTLNGSLFGALACTQLDVNAAWSDRHVQMLRKMSARITIAVAKIIELEEKNGRVNVA